MLKFVKNHMTSIGDIEIYPMISFIIFFLFFLIVLILVMRSSKTFISKMEQLPLEDGVVNGHTEIISSARTTNS